MLLVLLVIFGAALTVELLREYFYKKQVKNSITELDEYRVLEDKIKQLPQQLKQNSSLVIESDGYVGTLAIRQRSSGKYADKNFTQHYYIFVLDRENRSVKMITPLN